MNIPEGMLYLRATWGITMTEFMNALNAELKEEKQLTENGAVGFVTSGSAIVDFNFKMSSYRSKSESDIQHDFAKVFAADRTLAMKMLFFAGDIREGMGERKVFNACMAWLAQEHPDYCSAVIPLIPEYTRWDYVVKLLYGPCDAMAWALIYDQWCADEEKLNFKDPGVSLLAKWLPSINASNTERNGLGKKIARRLGLKERDYRKRLAALRARIKVVERQMSANAWDAIDYNGVPSKANIIYRNAFLKHDATRRMAYLDALKSGDASVKIHSDVAFPYEIAHGYMSDLGWYSRHVRAEDNTLEAMWKALPDYTKGLSTGGTLCVVDGSGSMFDSIGRTNIFAETVAVSIGIYFAEKLTGPFHDKFITFSEKPKLVDLSPYSTLAGKLARALKESDCSNTNIERTFDLILSAAVNGRLKQEELPATVLVISDMEFDNAIEVDNVGSLRFSVPGYAHARVYKTLFQNIETKFRKLGYKLPRLVFWNINSRTSTVPLQENECGVALVSGFSPAIASMVLSGKLDPLEVLMDRLNSKRYDAIGRALVNIK